MDWFKSLGEKIQDTPYSIGKTRKNNGFPLNTSISIMCGHHILPHASHKTCLSRRDSIWVSRQNMDISKHSQLIAFLFEYFIFYLPQMQIIRSRLNNLGLKYTYPSSAVLPCESSCYCYCSTGSFLRRCYSKSPQRKPQRPWHCTAALNFDRSARTNASHPGPPPKKAGEFSTHISTIVGVS